MKPLQTVFRMSDKLSNVIKSDLATSPIDHEEWLCQHPDEKSIAIDAATLTVGHLRRTGVQTKFVRVEPLFGPLNDIELAGIERAKVGGDSRPRMPPDAKRVGGVDSLPMRGSERPLLFQAVGGVNKRKPGES